MAKYFEERFASEIMKRVTCWKRDTGYNSLMSSVELYCAREQFL